MKKFVSLLIVLLMVLSLSAVPALADGLVVDTCILKEADDAMINNYSLLAVNPAAPFADADGNAVKDVELNTVGAAALINWLLSEEGRKLLLVLNRTLIGMPPVVCGLLFYMLFSGVGPFRHLRWLFTVKLMILAQVVLITPIIIGVMETFVADTAPALRETGCAVLLITHSIGQARRASDQLLFLQGGKLIEQGRTARLLSAPQREETKHFLDFYGR